VETLKDLPVKNVTTAILPLMTAVLTALKISDSFVLEMSLTFVLLPVETARKLLMRIVMTGTIFLMTAASFALLSLTLSAIL